MPRKYAPYDAGAYAVETVRRPWCPASRKPADVLAFRQRVARLLAFSESKAAGNVHHARLAAFLRAELAALENLRKPQNLAA